MLTLIQRINSAIADVIRWLIDALYIGALSRFISPTIWRYLACGVGNYIILDALLYYIIYHHIVAEHYLYLGIVTISPHISSMIILFPITFLTGFWLNRYVAFGSTTRAIGSQIIRYAISIAGSIVVSYLILKGLVEGLDVWPTPAKVVSSILTSTYSYLMARFFTFRG